MGARRRLKIDRTGRTKEFVKDGSIRKVHVVRVTVLVAIFACTWSSARNGNPRYLDGRILNYSTLSVNDCFCYVLGTGNVLFRSDHYARRKMFFFLNGQGIR